MLYDMGLVKIDPLKSRVFGSDYAKGDAKTTANINHLVKVIKAVVGLQDILHHNSGLIHHCRIEYFVEPWVLAWVFKRVRSMDPVKWNSSFNNCILQLTPSSSVNSNAAD